MIPQRLPRWSRARLSCSALVSALLLWGCTTGYLSRIEPTSSKWEKAIQAFESSDQSSPPPKSGVLFIGSSSIRMWKTLQTDFPDVSTINRGFGGSQIVDSLFYTPRIVLPYKPSKIFLYAGDNDIAKGKTARIILRDFKRFVTRVHQALPATEIHFIAIKPSISRWNLADEMSQANQMVESFAERDSRLHFVDIWTPMLDSRGEPSPDLFLRDGLHMNRKGYEIWVEAVAPFL